MRMHLFLIAAALGLGITGGAFAAKPPEVVPPGMAKYLLVLWEPGTPVPGQEASGRKVEHQRPDVVKLGGRVLYERGNRQVIYLPKGEARGLRRHAGVVYLQRIWTGESFDDWHESYVPEGSDARSRIASDSDTNLDWGPVNYDYDGSGNIKTAGNDSYTYDSAGRLIQSVVGGKTETFKYDAFGNLIEKGISGSAPVVMPVDGESNRLIGPEYDVAGNVVTTGNRDAYSYDSAGMMAALQRPTSYRRFIYDADDERLGRIHDAALSRWTIRDLDGKVLREFKSDDGEDSESGWFWEQDYVYAHGALVGGETQDWGLNAQRFGGRRHYHLDHLGSVRMTTNDQKKAVGLHDYYAFGVEQTAAWQEPLNPGDPHIDDARFTGHERDYLGTLNIENTEYLDYMHARYYDPTRGRFLSPDPMLGNLMEPQSWNRYSYVFNDPVNLIDPTGMLADEFGGAGASGAWGDGDCAEGGPGIRCPDINIPVSPTPNPTRDLLDRLSRNLELEGYAERVLGVPLPLTGMSVREHAKVTGHGVAAFIDGAFPFFDPLSGVYGDGSVEGLQYSHLAGRITQDAGWAVVGGQLVRIGKLGMNNRLFMKSKGLLNKNDYVRIGWSGKKGVGLIFRIAIGGKNAPGLLGKLPNRLRHIDFW